MNWQEVVEHPSLKDLPFKIELNERGQIVMSPTKVAHSAYQGEIGLLLNALIKTGRILTECAVDTRKGTKVADVAWASPGRYRRIKREVACSVAPEICVEVFFESNTKAEMEEKRQLYLEKGAKEVWFCDRGGGMSFYNVGGKLKKSPLCPDFPSKVKL